MTPWRPLCLHTTPVEVARNFSDQVDCYDSADVAVQISEPLECSFLRFYEQISFAQIVNKWRLN